MNILKLLKACLYPVLQGLTPNADKYVEMVRQSDMPGVDYQCDFCMSLGRELGRPPCEVAQEIVDNLQ